MGYKTVSKVKEDLECQPNAIETVLQATNRRYHASIHMQITDNSDNCKYKYTYIHIILHIILQDLLTPQKHEHVPLKRDYFKLKRIIFLSH